MLNRGLSRGLSAWVQMAVDHAAFMRKLRRGLGFMANQKQAIYFSTWRVHTARRYDPTTRALIYVVSRELSRGWNTWHSSWAAQAHKRVCSARCLSHLRVS